MDTTATLTGRAKFTGGRAIGARTRRELVGRGAHPFSQNACYVSAGPTSVGQLSQERCPTFYERFVKGRLDLVLSLVLLVLFAPVLLVVALGVRTSLGPGVIFRQTRVGFGGRPFTLYKFRSMAPDCRTVQLPFDGPDRRVTHKHPNDPRLTRFGRFLRSWSLDELPQLWNVLRGDMSLVGPRPELVGIVERYSPWQHGRHEVKPGLTGLWQVTSRGDGMMHENTELDLEYARRLGPFADLKILILTIPAVVGLRRGY